MLLQIVHYDSLCVFASEMHTLTHCCFPQSSTHTCLGRELPLVTLGNPTPSITDASRATHYKTEPSEGHNNSVICSISSHNQNPIGQVISTCFSVVLTAVNRKLRGDMNNWSVKYLLVWLAGKENRCQSHMYTCTWSDNHELCTHEYLT